MEVSILWCRSISTGREFPIAQFSGDTDAGMDDWAFVTSVERPEVVVAATVGEEYRGDADACQKLEARLNGELGRTDLRAPHLVRVENSFGPKGLSFQQFRKIYEPPTLFFRDVFTDSGEAVVVRRETIEEFQASGGIYRVMKNV